MEMASLGIDEYMHTHACAVVCGFKYTLSGHTYLETSSYIQSLKMKFS